MKALIVAPAWVGDLVMAHVLVQALLNKSESAEIHLLAPSATAPLATRLPGIAKVHELRVASGAWAWSERRRSGLALRRYAFDAAYVLPNSFKSALPPWWAQIPRRVGWRGEVRHWLLNDCRRLDPKRYPKMVERFIALAYPPDTPMVEPLPTPALRVDPSNRTALLRRLRLALDRPLAALCPGAEFGPSKRWPPEHFAALAQTLLRRQRAVWLFGSSKDKKLGAAIAMRAPGVVDLTGCTSLPDAVDLLSLADAVVTNDSGLMHVACALSLKVVALFGSTSPDFTPPLSTDAMVLAKTLDCRPCFQRQCPLGHLNCLRQLTPEAVLGCLNP